MSSLPTPKKFSAFLLHKESESFVTTTLLFLILPSMAYTVHAESHCYQTVLQGLL